MSTFYASTGSLVVKGDILANDTLSGLAARNGVTPVAGDIMLATAQTDQTTNGPYIARAGAWDRIISVQTGQLFYVSSGTDAGTTFQLRTAAISPSSFNSGTGACGTNLSLVSVTSSAGSFDPGAPGDIGGDTPGQGTFEAVSVTGNPPTPAAGQVGLYKQVKPDATLRLGIQNAAGAKLDIGSGSASATASASFEVEAFSLANDATKDLVPGNGGTMLVVVPGATTCPMAHVGFAADGSTSLNGVTPAGGISLTLDNATTLNLYASGGNTRFQNKTGVSINVLVQRLVFGAT